MRSHLLAPLALLAAFGTTLPARAAGSVKLTPASGHPSLPVTIAGSSFGDNEAIDIYVDTVDTLLLVSSATGTFSGLVTIPASAQPGKHYVTAVGRHSGTAAQGGFSVTTPWTEQGFGAAHLGWNPYEDTLNASNVSSLGTLWQIAANGYGGTPAVSGNRVFLGTTGGLVAVTATSGSLLWKALPSSEFYASPAVVGSRLYIGDHANSVMYALNTTTGATLWSQAAGGTFDSSAIVSGGMVYAGCNDGKVYAFSAATGKIVWTYTTGGYVDSSPAIVNGVLYIGSSDDSVYALNAATGALIWSYKTGGAVVTAPAVSNGVVYVGSLDANLYAIDTKSHVNGRLLWAFTTDPNRAYPISAAAVAYGFVYFSSNDGNIYALNANSGSLQWSNQSGIGGNPAVANGVVYITSNFLAGKFLAIDALSGKTLATSSTSMTLDGTPTISDGVVYLNSFGDAYAFSLLAGTSAVRARPPAPASLHPDMRLTVKHY